MDDAADRYDYTDTLDPPDAPWDERDEDDGRADAGFYDDPFASQEDADRFDRAVWGDPPL